VTKVGRDSFDSGKELAVVCWPPKAHTCCGNPKLARCHLPTGGLTAA